MKKRVITAVLTLAMTLSLCAPAMATRPGEQEAANELYSLGLFRGDVSGFHLDEIATRQEAAAMMVRLLGREKTALTGVWKQPFKDVSPWAEGYVGYAYEKGLVSGFSKDYFGSGDSVTVEQYLTFTLRCLGYSDARGDFSWYSPWPLAERLGLSQPGEHPENEKCTEWR